MSKAKIDRIRKRDDSLVPFNPDKIELAIYKALVATKAGDRGLAAQLASGVVEILKERIGKDIPTVEQVQDTVEEVLMIWGYPSVPRACILYCQQRADVHRLNGAIGVREDMKLGIDAIKVLEAARTEPVHSRVSWGDK